MAVSIVLQPGHWSPQLSRGSSAHVVGSSEIKNRVSAIPMREISIRTWRNISYRQAGQWFVPPRLMEQSKSSFCKSKVMSPRKSIDSKSCIFADSLLFAGYTASLEEELEKGLVWPVVCITCIPALTARLFVSATEDGFNVS